MWRDDRGRGALLGAEREWDGDRAVGLYVGDRLCHDLALAAPGPARVAAAAAAAAAGPRLGGVGRQPAHYRGRESADWRRIGERAALRAGRALRNE